MGDWRDDTRVNETKRREEEINLKGDEPKHYDHVCLVCCRSKTAPTHRGSDQTSEGTRPLQLIKSAYIKKEKLHSTATVFYLLIQHMGKVQTAVFVFLC